MKPSKNKSTRLCRHNLLRASAIKNLGGHDDCLDTDENLEFAERQLFISRRVISQGDFSELAVRALSTRSGNTLGAGLPERFLFSVFALAAP